MCELANHLPSGAVLDQQRILTTDSRTTRDIGHLDEQTAARIHRGYPTVNEPLIRLHFRWRQAHFVGKGRATVTDPVENFLELGVVTNQLQERLMLCALLANAEEVFCCRVQAFDQQAIVDDDDGCAELIDKGKIGWRPITTGRIFFLSGLGRA